MNSDATWKCWNAEGHADTRPPGNWMEYDFDDSAWCDLVHHGADMRPQRAYCVALTCSLLYQAECGLIPAQRLPRQSLGGCHPHVRNAHVGHRGSLSGIARPLHTTECTRCPRKPGYPDTAGHVKPGIADAAEWIWTRDPEQHNDVYCRGNFYNGGR